MLRILIADEDAGGRHRVAHALQHSGLQFSLCETTSVKEALNACKGESFDVAIVDHQLPGQHGLSGVCRLHKLCPSMAIVLTTGPEAVMAATAREASDYLPKTNITADSIRRAVESSLEKSRLRLAVVKQQMLLLAAERHAQDLAKELERAEEALQTRTRALEMRDDFLSHVSHELRSPLAAISAFSSIIEDGLAGPTTDDQREYLGIIQKNAKQLESMIEDLLAVRALQTGKLRSDPQEASLGQAIVDALQTCEAKAKTKGVALSSNVVDCLGAAYADPVRLVQVLIILCDNAIKFTPPGGSVQVRAHARDARYLLAEVADSGCGIGPEQQERIFDHLYQVADASRSGRTGLGLGLHIARELVTQQGGQIWAESTLGSGSRFCFTVPVFAEKVAEVHRQAA